MRSRLLPVDQLTSLLATVAPAGFHLNPEVLILPGWLLRFVHLISVDRGQRGTCNVSNAIVKARIDRLLLRLF